jgi:hypothetical protein
MELGMGKKIKSQFFVARLRRATKNWDFINPQIPYPFNLPLSWLGLPRQRTHLLPADWTQTPFANEFEYAILGPIGLGLGPFEEVAFLHARSHTLLVTDTVVSVPLDPPAIVQLDPYPLLYHAKDHTFDRVEDTFAMRRKGWQRISLFAFYFSPSALETVKLGQAWREARQAPNRSSKAYWGLYPFRWQDDWQRSFEALRGEGRLLVAPILQTLILNRAPQTVLNWADRVASWQFERIIPCHFVAPIAAALSNFGKPLLFWRKLQLGDGIVLPQ